MPVDLTKSLVIGISSSALFDMAEADGVFRKEGLEAYRDFQISRADRPLEPGAGFPLIRAVLKLNEAVIHDALYRAYFVDGMNIAQIDNLIAVVRQLGLPEDEAREFLVSRQFRGAVDADWQRCQDFGITAVPTFVVGNQGVVGAQTYETLEALVVKGGAVRR